MADDLTLSVGYPAESIALFRFMWFRYQSGHQGERI
jgi:hypothetical protein